MNKLYVVGIGPGAAEELTPRARSALEQAELIVGYNTYAELLRPLFPEKEYLQTPMTREVDRCRSAVDAACAGRRVALISSGDAGVYGMATLALQLAQGRGVEVEVIPGITAALSGAALLGAPLSHDFAAISLSDMLTSRETIARRLSLAAQGDFCIALYNPASHRRKDTLQRACDILLQYKAAETVCGIARNVGRAGEEARVLTLAELRDAEADMFTIAFVGNAQTRIVDGRMVTPRGYRDV